MCIYQYIDREWGTVGVRFFHWCCFKISSICQRCCCKISSICIPQNFIQLGSQETKHNAHAQREAKQRYQRFYVIATLPLWMNKITPLISDALRWYIHTVLYLYIYIGMYCGRTVGLKSCAYTIHIQVCTSGNKKLQGHTRTWKQTRQTAETIQFGRNMPKYIHFCYEILYCIEPMSEKFQFCLVAPCSNDRVVFASMLHVFIASVNKRKQHFWLTEDFILSPSSTASSWQSSRHKKKEIWNVLQG